MRNPKGFLITQMRALIVLLALCLTVRSQVLLTNVYTNPGFTHNVFVQTMHGGNTNTVYLWQSATNLIGPWVEERPPFSGSGQDQTFYFLSPTNVNMEFFRVLTVASISKQVDAFDGSTTNIVTCTTNLVCVTNCTSCFTNPPPMPPQPTQSTSATAREALLP